MLLDRPYIPLSSISLLSKCADFIYILSSDPCASNKKLCGLFKKKWRGSMSPWYNAELIAARYDVAAQDILGHVIVKQIKWNHVIEKEIV